MSYLKHPRSQYSTATSEQKTNPAVIYLNAHYLPPPWHSETLGTQSNHRPSRYSRSVRRP
ncbi:unnamed protein product [Hymenolepis diminuta]|uniref:Uncharacterized protein n=1 Tax=Hymenolepis diminuta TaxID=6216 RepID=A0A564Z5S2_HYMDI|nr:unnamed protein product [Hymenolepis diminuta]